MKKNKNRIDNCVINLKKKVLSIYNYCLKQIPTIFYSCELNSLEKQKNWILKISRLYFRLVKILPICSITTYVSKYSDSVKSVINNSPEVYSSIKKNWINIFKEEADDVRFFMTYLFYECGIFDSEIVKLIMDFANSTLSLNHRYWTTMHISKMLFFNQNGFYPEYYIDRRKLLKEIAIETKKPNKTHSKGKDIHIVIITYLLDNNLKNSMQRVATMVSKNLKRDDNRITVLCLDSLHQPKTEKKNVIELIHYNASIEVSQEIQKLMGDGVQLEYINGDNYLDKMNNAIEALYKMSPNIIIDIADEYSPLSYYYSQDFFTVYLPMRAAATSQFYSAILGTPFKYQQTNKRYNNCVDMSKVLEWSFPEYIPPDQGTFTKGDIGLNENQFCILSIGNNSSFNNEFVDEICRVLKNNEKLVWLLIGSSAPLYLHQNYADLINNGQIIEWGYEKNLAGICRACDVHLRYDVTGGSGGTAIAAMQGLPIVMTNYICDASRWLGLDYSSIDNYSDLADEIQKIYSDKNYYEERKKITMELVKKAVDTKEKWDNLYQILIDAYERWKLKGHV